MTSFKQSLLWRIEHSDLPFTSYIFGTMHMRRQGHLPILPTAMYYMSTCQRFFAEMDLDAALPPSLEPGNNWYQPLSSRKFERMARMIHKLTGASASQIRRLPPLYWINAISSKMVTDQAPAFYLDQHLWREAGNLQLERGGLESVEEQMALFNNIQLDQQLKMLHDITRNISRFRRHMTKMNLRYERGDIQQLYQSSRASMGKLRGPMLYHRNRIMGARLAPYLQEGPVFAAVGAAHLAGPKGILRLLKDHGFRSHPVPANNPSSLEI